MSKPKPAFDSQTATIADILAAAPAYAETLRGYKLDARDATIRRLALFGVEIVLTIVVLR